MTARVRAAGPWLVVATVITLVILLVVWPVLMGYAVGVISGLVALRIGLRMFIEEQRPVRDCYACDAGIEHPEHCPTPETHNWACGCPTDQSSARADEMGQQ